jgi:hypothetical protein
MLALYPQMADADALTQTRLINAWFRRQQLAARLIAIEVGQLFGGASTGSAGGYEMIDEDAALAALGVTPKRFDVRDNEPAV